jgi:archaellum component FlaD/FlaE
MTIDPDDYDLRELRRIADERRDTRGSDDDASAESRRRADRHRERERRSDDRHRNGQDRGQNGQDHRQNGQNHRQNGQEQHRNGQDHHRNGQDRHRNGHAADHAAADDVTVRPRAGTDRSHDGDSEFAHSDDDVVRADQIARDLGFGDITDGRDRNGRADHRSRHRSRRGRVDRPGFETDDVGRFQFDTNVRERPRSRPGKALRENQLEQLLVHETAASGELSKPYLTSHPNAYAAERLIFDWLEFLVLKGGYKRTMDALRYYHTVGWLTDDVEVELRDYLVGFSGEVSDTETYDVADHHLSLVYIARLASMT